MSKASISAHSFPKASLSENCSLLGTDNVRGQISVHIFAQNRGYCVYHRATHMKKCSQIARCIYVFSKIKSLRSHLKPYFFTRQFRPRPRRLLSSDGKSLLNLWFIPHYTEVKEEYSIGDERKA